MLLLNNTIKPFTFGEKILKKSVFGVTADDFL